jgi:hypothetical protein
MEAFVGASPDRWAVVIGNTESTTERVLTADARFASIRQTLQLATDAIHDTQPETDAQPTQA